MDIKNTTNIDKKKVEAKKDLAWSKPLITNLGNAKEIVANVNVQGAGDSVFSVLDPS